MRRHSWYFLSFNIKDSSLIFSISNSSLIPNLTEDSQIARLILLIPYSSVNLKACAIALKQHPRVNSQWFEDKMRLNHHVHIGVAVVVLDGLVVPVVKFANEKSLTDSKFVFIKSNCVYFDLIILSNFLFKEEFLFTLIFSPSSGSLMC